MAGVAGVPVVGLTPAAGAAGGGPTGGAIGADGGAGGMFASGAAETAADRGAGDGCDTDGAAERRLRGGFLAIKILPDHRRAEWRRWSVRNESSSM